MSEPLSLWLIDRSSFYTGCGSCPRERWLTRHEGPTGYGMVLRAESLPLVTGQHVHQAIADILRAYASTDVLERAVIRAAIANAVAAYEHRIEARGFRGLLAGEAVEQVVREQQCLLGGLVWAWSRTILPWILAEYRILQVEQERVVVLGCTCGAGPLDAAVHDARGCQGIGLPLRQDCVMERRTSGNLAYLEQKTTGRPGDSWAEQWETQPQFGLGTLGLAEQYGREVTELYVAGLSKGRRLKDRATGQYYQSSPFAYGYKRPGNPPLYEDDWLPTYEWIDEAGKTRRAPRDYERTGVWELLETDWSRLRPRPTTLPEAIERWVDLLPESVVNNQIFRVGPLNRQDTQIAMITRQIPAEERRWQAIAWELFDLRQAGADWSSETYQQKLDELVPCSWQCRRYGSRHECEFVKLCFRHAGWEDPIGLGQYVPRIPHHQAELDQAVARGLLPEQGEEAAEEE